MNTEDEHKSSIENAKGSSLRLVFDIATAIGALIAIVIGIFGYQQGKHAAILAEKNAREILQPRWQSQKSSNTFILTGLSGGQKAIDVKVFYLHPETGNILDIKDSVFSGDLGYGGVRILENKFFRFANVIYSSGNSGLTIQSNMKQENNGRHDIAVDHRLGWQITGKYPIVIRTNYSDAEGKKQIKSLYDIVLIARYHPKDTNCKVNYFLSEARNASHLYNDAGIAQLNFVRHLDKGEQVAGALNAKKFIFDASSDGNIPLDIDLLSSAIFWVHEC